MTSNHDASIVSEAGDSGSGDLGRGDSEACDSGSGVMVIGGGPAGSTCALRLRQHGLEVDLVERDHFPRSKVCGCCLGGAGLAALESIEMDARIVRQGVALNRWCGSIGRREINVDLPAGLAISRELFDRELLDAAKEAGVRVLQPCRAELVASDAGGVTVELEGERGPLPSRIVYGCVIVAAGLKAAGLSRFLPWVKSPVGPFGAGFTADHDGGCEEGVIYMACDDDGYVGLVRLENGKIDVAAALRSGAARASYGKPQQRIERILSASELPAIGWSSPSSLVTTPPLRRQRLVGRGRLLAIGDAAGYVEPFTGEGITWAMQSGIEAADLIGADPSAWLTAGEQWRQIYADRFRTPKRVCHAVTSALRSSVARRAVGQTLATWPQLARPLLRRLRGKSPPPLTRPDQRERTERIYEP